MLDRKIIRRVLILGAIGIIGILAIQAYLLNENYRLQLREWDQEVRVALLSVARQLAEFNGTDLPRTNLVRRVTPRYYVVNINDEIDANVLELYLFQELDGLSVQQDFEYAIYDCSNNAMVYGDYCSIEEGRLLKNGVEDLPRYKDLTYYFGVRFPDRNVLWYGNNNLLYLLGGILALATFLFSYCVYIIIRQQRLAAMQRDFISNITHEFKTPLTSIKIAAQAFKDHPTIKADDRMRRYAEIITNQGDHLHDQVMRVLGLSKMERGESILDIQDVDLVSLTQSAIDQSVLDADKENIHTILNVDECDVKGDPFHIKSIFSNLIDNAIKYNNHPMEINISLSSSDHYYIWKIEDNGIGMTKEQVDMCLEKYYRASNDDKHNVKGFGLGLYYVSQIVAAHQWTLSIDSEVQKGTTISLKIPK